MAAAAILDCRIRKILLAIVAIVVEIFTAHQRAKFCQNWSIDCDDIEIFRFFKMAAVRYLGLMLGIFGQLTVSACGSLSLCKIWS